MLEKQLLLRNVPYLRRTFNAWRQLRFQLKEQEKREHAYQRLQQVHRASFSHHECHRTCGITPVTGNVTPPGTETVFTTGVWLVAPAPVWTARPAWARSWAVAIPAIWPLCLATATVVAAALADTAVAVVA